MNQETATVKLSDSRGESGQQIGKVVHYFDKAMVAVVKLTNKITVGDIIKVAYQEKEFSQKVESMEVNHEKVQSGKAGEEVAIKLDQESHEGAVVYKIN